MKVFLSHSVADRDLALAVEDRLNELGHLVVDPFEMFEAVGIAAELTTAIRASDVVLAILTVNRPNLYYEVGLARGANRPLVVAARDFSGLPIDVVSEPYVALVGDVGEDAAAIVSRIEELRPALGSEVPRFNSPEETLRAITEDTDLASLIGPIEFEGVLADYFRNRYANLLEANSGPGLFDFGFNTHGGHLIIVEAKKYASTSRVSVDAVLRLAGAVTASRAHAGLLIATSGFTTAARSLAETLPVTLRSLSEVLGSANDEELLGVGYADADLGRLARRLRAGEDNVSADIVERLVRSNRVDQMVNLARDPASNGPTKRRQLAVILVMQGEAEAVSRFDELIRNNAERRTVALACLDRLRERDDDEALRLLLKIYRAVREPQRRDVRDHASKLGLPINWPAVDPNP